MRYVGKQGSAVVGEIDEAFAKRLPSVCTERLMRRVRSAARPMSGEAARKRHQVGARQGCIHPQLYKAIARVAVLSKGYCELYGRHDPPRRRSAATGDVRPTDDSQLAGGASPAVAPADASAGEVGAPGQSHRRHTRACTTRASHSKTHITQHTHVGFVSTCAFSSRFSTQR